MGYAPHRHGPHRPVQDTPPPGPGVVRWTFVADCTSPNGLGNPPLLCNAEARASHVDEHGRLHGKGTASVQLEFTDMDRSIRAISATDKGNPLDLDDLVGGSVAGGFRARLASLVAERGGMSPLAEFVLDDLPGITLVAGYAFQFEDSRTGRELLTALMTSAGDAAIDHQAGTCAGWAEDATLVTWLRRDRDLLTPIGPDAPRPWGDDPASEGWPVPGNPRTDSTRRVRRIDLHPDSNGVRRFETHFRDSHVDFEGTERVLHEYLAAGTLRDGVIERIDAEARVLPWQECPGAVASVSRAVGAPVERLRSLVRAEFRGVSTCTHLNDTLRSLESLAAMAR